MSTEAHDESHYGFATPADRHRMHVANRRASCEELTRDIVAMERRGLITQQEKSTHAAKVAALRELRHP